MPKYTIICDPNYKAGGNCDFRVHKHNCQDAVRHGTKIRNRGHTVEAENVEAAIAEDLKGWTDQDMGFTRSDYFVCPCCKNA